MTQEQMKDALTPGVKITRAEAKKGPLTYSVRAWLTGLLAGASLTMMAVSTPSHAFNPSPAPEPVPVTAPVERQAPDLAEIVARVSPSVVQIMVRQSAPLQRVSTPDSFNDLPPELREFFGPNFRFFFDEGSRIPRRGPDRVGSGSGFFLHDGYIVTNNHVVDNASKLTVRFENGEEAEGVLVGSDAKTDIAVIKVDRKYARKPLAWGDSKRVRPGDNIFTIGAPFALGNTVTAGIVSARGRDIGSGPYDDYLQIDAPINPGNSGGPMFNAAGEVIGVNTAIFSPSGGNVGIGFAIPAEQASLVAQQIIERGYVERGWLGVNIQRMTPDIASSLGRSEAKGALVADVTPGSPAEKAGLKPMDVILSYGGRPIGAVHDLTRAVADTRPGLNQDLRIWREGREHNVRVRIETLKTAARPPLAGASSQDKTVLNTGLGLEVAQDDEGLIVAAVVSGSPAQEAGLRIGDRILTIGESKPKSAKDAQDAVRAARTKGRQAVLVQIERDGAKRFIGVPLSTS